MDTLQSALEQRFKVVKQRERTPRQLAIDRVMETIKDQPWGFPRWGRYLKGIPPQEIHTMIASAEKNSNVGRHFNWLVSQYRNEKK